MHLFRYLLLNSCKALLTIPVLSSLKVDFDRTRHLSDRSIKYRKTVREKLIQEDIDKERAEKLKRGREGPTADENRSEYSPILINEEKPNDRDRLFLILDHKAKLIRRKEVTQTPLVTKPAD